MRWTIPYLAPLPSGSARIVEGRFSAQTFPLSAVPNDRNAGSTAEPACGSGGPRRLLSSTPFRDPAFQQARRSIGVGPFEKKGRLTMTKARVRAFPQTCLAMAALLPFAAAGSRAETLDQLYEKAKLDRTLVFYSGGPAAPHETGRRSSCRNFLASRSR